MKNSEVSGIIDINIDHFGDETDIIIPVGAVSIVDFGFKDCDWIESVHIPDSVRSIGGYAFEGCTSLKKVRFSSDISRIEIGAFKQCEMLEEMIIPEGVTEIGDYAFADCSSLRRVVLPDTLLSIGESSFANCELLEEIELPASLTELGELSFYACCGLMKAELPEGLKTVSNHAFSGCTSLQKIRIPDSVTHIESCAFSECTALSEVVIGSGVNIIGVSAFEDTALSSVIIPKSVNHIDSEAFSKCRELSDVYIEGRAFAEQNSFVNVRIIAPEKCIMDWEYQDQKYAVVRGFAKGLSDGVVFASDVAERNHKYIRSQRAKLYDVALSDEYVMEYMLNNRVIPLKDVAMLLDKAEGNTILTAQLLNYRSSFSKKELDAFENGEYKL